eukprot:7266110-Prymnesium_polylepis.2
MLAVAPTRLRTARKRHGSAHRVQVLDDPRALHLVAPCRHLLHNLMPMLTAPLGGARHTPRSGATASDRRGASAFLGRWASVPELVLTLAGAEVALPAVRREDGRWPAGQSQHPHGRERGELRVVLLHQHVGAHPACPASLALAVVQRALDAAHGRVHRERPARVSDALRVSLVALAARGLCQLCQRVPVRTGGLAGRVAEPHLGGAQCPCPVGREAGVAQRKVGRARQTQLVRPRVEDIHTLGRVGDGGDIFAERHRVLKHRLQVVVADQVRVEHAESRDADRDERVQVASEPPPLLG